MQIREKMLIHLTNARLDVIINWMKKAPSWPLLFLLTLLTVFLFAVLILDNERLKREADQFPLYWKWKYIDFTSSCMNNLKPVDEWTEGDRLCSAQLCFKRRKNAFGRLTTVFKYQSMEK